MFKKILACAMAAFMALGSLALPQAIGNTISAKAIPIVDSNEGEEEIIYYYIGNSSTTRVIFEQDEYVHTGSAIEPNLTVEYRSIPTDENPDPPYRTLSSETDYTVIFSNNVEVGEATVAIKGINYHFGTYKTTFPIVHDYSEEWTIDVEPTTTTEGSKSHHCIVFPTILLNLRRF